MDKRLLIILFSSVLISACNNRPIIKSVEQVDIPRFMGKWYVIANIPTFIEKSAHNATESYRQAKDGRILTTFEFNKDSFDGEKKRYDPIGRVQDESNAIWTMQFLWPFQSDFRIIYLDKNYQHTVIGRNNRDYVWIMARHPNITDTDYATMLEVISSQGYDMSKIQRVPHKSN